MAAQHQTFAADVDRWAQASKARLLAIFRESAQRVVSRAQAYISGELVNVQTGFLRASIRASKSSMPQVDPAARHDGKTAVSYDPGSVTLAIASAELGEKVFVGYTASYAPLVHWGTSKMRPRPWVTLAANEWQRTVSEVAAEAKSKAG